MRMRRNSPVSLRETVNGAGDAVSRAVMATHASVTWSQLTQGSTLGGRSSSFLRRSVLIATADQLSAVAALIELDGMAERIVLYPPDLSLEHLAFVAKAAGVNLIVSDRLTDRSGLIDCETIKPSAWASASEASSAVAAIATEWVLLTSGTTGRPKLVLHTLASLTSAIESASAATSDVVWSTFYDIRRYGGLQIFLRAALTGTSLLLSSAQETTAAFLARAAANSVTHISGTPSHWRRALMSSSAHLIDPEYVRLSGEAADQGILNQLRSQYPKARIAHAFATTEAGVGFAVNDGIMGFPASMLDHTPGVEMKVLERSLRIRSDRTARCYLGDDAPALQDSEGFVNTGDVVELHGDRYHFVGRADGMINVGGMKVFPEEVEAVINGHPRVQMSLVRTKKNPITGALVVADVVLIPFPDTVENDVAALHRDILRLCREALPAHKVPATIQFVPELAVADSGKLIRRHA